MTKLGIAINKTRCIGCQTCAHACKMQNNVPSGMRWNRVLTEGCDVEDGALGEFPNLSRGYLPVACQHCENPACLRVCPTGATYKDALGRVEVDYEKCIGCRMCMAACPYNARVFNWNDPKREPDFNYGDKDVPVRGKGVVEKCTLCKERTDRGEEPMCVKCCPVKARTFGDLDDPNSEISKLVVARKAGVLLEEQGTRPQVHYFN
ncbi:4Fe-4S dicluster domain-containing protein [Eggerthella guodeyinii]|uniref:4Fe-4S dicluster domain-containing protein n=1 Tax=Eggerthella guodeyinii TaxID=2690837 RepID=A0A6N7RT98_9ACTN|nr:4Fe-4S dicluster domain-containing protein [Eggerthella guodeyinii]MRX83998.1 4Fe-4S dicluster domain-containing protein [Eggerthella guodeyinii]